MVGSRASLLAFTMVAALTVVACGGGDDDAEPDAATEAPTDDAGQPTDDDPGTDSDADQDAGAGDDVSPEPPAAPSGEFEVPVARFAAHGPGAANTIAPPCGVGNEDRGGDLFRFTPPPEFSWTGSSGGSGRDEIEVIGPDEVTLTFVEATTPSELSLVDGYAVVGPTGTEVTIDGTSIPVMEVTAEGSTAYALVDLPYLDPLPLLMEGAAWGTAIVYSDTEGRPTLDEATAILETVRVERCAAVSQALIWGAGGGFGAVPRFEPDPLGKTWPDEPQPAILGLPALDAYSVEQLAYLMPVEAERSTCAAETALAEWGDDPLGLLKAVTPSGTQRDEFAALIAEC